MKKISIIEMNKYNYYSSIRKNNKLQQQIISHIPIKTNHVIRLCDVYDASLRIYVSQENMKTTAVDKRISEQCKLKSVNNNKNVINKEGAIWL